MVRSFFSRGVSRAVVSCQSNPTMPAETGSLVDEVIIFNILQFLALFLLVITFLPAVFASSVYRMKTWYALLISNAIYCFSFLLLVGHQTGPEPPLPLCALQAGLMYDFVFSDYIVNDSYQSYAAPPLQVLCSIWLYVC